MLKLLIPYGIKKITSIVVGIPIKIFLLLQALNPLTWIRLSRNIHKMPDTADMDAANEDADSKYDPLRPPPPTEKQMAAWHMPDQKRLAVLERINLGQKLLLLLFLIIPSLFSLVVWKGWGSVTFSTPLLMFNFFILIFMVMLPTYIRLAVVRRQLELKRLVTVMDLKKLQCWW